MYLEYFSPREAQALSRVGGGVKSGSTGAGRERKSGRQAAPGNQSQHARESTSEGRDPLSGAGRASGQISRAEVLLHLNHK